jgi:D-beta-D-heptose 7-phosphate kinase/D-beta-D-heptose 1-phosphate adenosyltransferase
VKTLSKILSLNALKKKIATLHRQGKKIALTNGCFDILHFGHVSYLEQAKKPNRILIVALNSDASVRSIKGPKRPIVGQKYRAGLLAALSCVDFVTIFNEDTPLKVIKTLKPDVLIKGADWKGKEVVGKDVVENNGGKMEYIRFVSGLSTSNIIQTIAQRCQE